MFVFCLYVPFIIYYSEKNWQQSKGSRYRARPGRKKCQTRSSALTEI